MSREQEVVRDAVTGRYESEENKGPEDYATTEEHLSEWQKEWRRIGEVMEFNHITATGDPCPDVVNAMACNAMIHAMQLRRP